MKVDKKWQAESDAQTLAQYQEIMNSPSRKNAAIKAAKAQAAALERRANAMKMASGGKIKK